MNKLIYLRVSKEELDEESQLPVILQDFKLNENDCIILRERVSAYSEEKQKNRTEFIRAKQMIEDGEVTEVYVFSLERFERNLKRMLEFYFFCEVHNCTIYSALQPYLNNLFPKPIEKELAKNPIYQFIRYLLVLVYGFLAENESFFTSRRTRKVIRRNGLITSSKDGNKWGQKIRGTPNHPDINKNGKVDLTPGQVEKLHAYIIKTFQKEKEKIGYCQNIATKVEKKFKLIISPSYVSRLLNRNNYKD